MKKKTISLLIAAIFFAVVLAVLWFLLTPCPDTIMTVDDNGLEPWGVLEIPSANIETLLYPVHVDNCCDIVLWNGGRIHADDAEAFAEIKLWDTACTRIETERLVLECVSIDPCVTIGGWLVGCRGIIRPGGDVLIVGGNRVYRFVML